jgi:hypothetical protein
MDEAGVDHRIRLGRTAAQAVGIPEVAVVRPGACGEERFGARIGTGEAEHLMARADQVLNDGGADEAGGAGDEDTHEGDLL